MISPFYRKENTECQRWVYHSYSLHADLKIYSTLVTV